MDGEAPRPTDDEGDHLGDVLRRDIDLAVELFLNAGIGFGGGWLPKDIRAFGARAGELGADQALTVLREVDAINMRRPLQDRRSRPRRRRRLAGGPQDRRPRRRVQTSERRHP